MSSNGPSPVTAGWAIDQTLGARLLRAESKLKNQYGQS